MEHVAHEDVLDDVEVGEEAGVLVHDGDAALPRVEGRREGDRGAVDEDAAAGRVIDSGEHLDAGALARAVLAEKRQHLAGAEAEGDVAERGGAAERLRGVQRPMTSPAVDAPSD